MEALILQLLSGAIGGTALGALSKKLTLGTIGDALAGTMGGVGSGHLLTALGLFATGSSVSVGLVVSSLAVGGIGGAGTLLLIHQIKKLISNH